MSDRWIFAMGWTTLFSALARLIQNNETCVLFILGNGMLMVALMRKLYPWERRAAQPEQERQCK